MLAMSLVATISLDTNQKQTIECIGMVYISVKIKKIYVYFAWKNSFAKVEGKEDSEYGNNVSEIIITIME